MEKIFLMSNPRRKRSRKRSKARRKVRNSRRKSAVASVKVYRNPRRIGRRSFGGGGKLNVISIAKMVIPATAGVVGGFLIPNLLRIPAKFKFIAPAGLGIATILIGGKFIGKDTANALGGGMITASALMLVNEYILKPKGMGFLSIPQTVTTSGTGFADDSEELSDIQALSEADDESLSDISSLSSDEDENGEGLESAYYNRFSKYDE